MANNTEYAEENEIVDFVADVMADPQYTELRALSDEQLVIKAAFAYVYDNEGNDKRGSGAAVKLKKVHECFKIFIKGAEKKEHAYVLVFDHYAWSELSPIQRRAMVFEALYSLEVVRDTEGHLKIKSRKPDIVTNTATTRHFGAWNPTLSDVFDMLTPRRKPLAQAISRPSADDEEPRPRSRSRKPVPEVPAESTVETPPADREEPLTDAAAEQPEAETAVESTGTAEAETSDAAEDAPKAESFDEPPARRRAIPQDIPQDSEADSPVPLD